jgi:hypothetical protein
MSMPQRFEYGPVYPYLPPHSEYGPAYQSKNGPVYRSEYGPVYPVIHGYDSIKDTTRRAAEKKKVNDAVAILHAKYNAKKAIRDALPKPPPVIEYYSPAVESELLNSIRHFEDAKARALSQYELDDINAELQVSNAYLEEERLKPHLTNAFSG